MIVARKSVDTGGVVPVAVTSAVVPADVPVGAAIERVAAEVHVPVPPKLIAVTAPFETTAVAVTFVHHVRVTVGALV